MFLSNTSNEHELDSVAGRHQHYYCYYYSLGYISGGQFSAATTSLRRFVLPPTRQDGGHPLVHVYVIPTSTFPTLQVSKVHFLLCNLRRTLARFFRSRAESVSATPNMSGRTRPIEKFAKATAQCSAQVRTFTYQGVRASVIH